MFTYSNLPTYFTNILFTDAVRSYNYPTYYVALTGNEAYIKEEPTKKWKIIPGICKVIGAWTFQSTDLPGAYLRHSDYLIFQDDYVDSDLYRNDACFIARRNKFFSGTVAFESVNYQNYYIRHQDYRLKISKLEDTDLFKQDASFYVE